MHRPDLLNRRRLLQGSGLALVLPALECLGADQKGLVVLQDGWFVLAATLDFILETFFHKMRVRNTRQRRP